ncbi:hypothetical protein TIFTF001_013296 [Ficus carica]|uniref:Uncharacterized protein n=1 Tax=Ficus carica TaxID=3494 RepID=A0AA87ZXG2_FICCA|nr:hypothetical protein TIFTF001_013296 [Ficus carica]
MRGKGKAAAGDEEIPVVAKFESELARKRFNDSFAGRNLWHERGFAYMSSDTLGYLEYKYSVIFKNNWKNFCKRVDISGVAINKVYRLDDVEDEYLEFSKRVEKVGLWFPSLITSLCLAQGVEVSSEEEKLKQFRPIIMTVITRLLHDKPAVAGEENPSPVPEARPPKHSNHIPSGEGSNFLQLEHRIS